jgi:hypothetical protein
MAIATLRMKAMRQRSEVMMSLQLSKNLTHTPENRLKAPTATVHDEHDDSMNTKKTSSRDPS